MTDIIRVFSDTRSPNCVTPSVAASEGKKTDEGTRRCRRQAKSNPVAVADPPEGQTLTPVRAKWATDMMIDCKTEFCGGTQKLKGAICPATYRLLLAPRSSGGRAAPQCIPVLRSLFSQRLLSLVRLRPLMILQVAVRLISQNLRCLWSADSRPF